MDRSSSIDPEVRLSQNSRLYRWLDERLGLSALIAYARKKTVPEHAHSFWYYWGGVTLFFFGMLCLTGVLLLVYYRPGAEAHESVRQITYDIHFGWLIRSTHSWAANLMIAAAFIHMFSAYFMKAYRRPREFTWWSGLGLLLLAMTFGFSGYLLPMDELAFFATKVGLEIPKSLPQVGPFVADLIRGGPEVSEFTVQRFFTLHVVILPAVFVPLLGFHLWLVQKHGNAVPVSEELKPEAQRRFIPFFPNFALKDLALWLIALNVLALLAVFFPWELGAPADPLTPAPVGIHPEWYYMSSFQVLKLFGEWFPGMAGEMLGMSLFTLGLGLWAVIPLYDSGSLLGRRGRMATWFGLFALAVLVVTTIWAYAALSAVRNMNYPFWDVPLIGSGWVIGAIAIFHVLVSHFAIGGGFYLPLAEAKALREGDAGWMQALRGHAKFFLILTGVFGALTGVGIWFAIGLAHPEATSTLIHYFVFGWAMEWVVFIVELSAAAVYYYTWGRLSDRLHLAVGWVYAGSAWLSLVIINGILTFMLTPGAAWLERAGSGTETAAFFSAFLNPTYWPSLCLRTLVCISLAGIFALFTFSRLDGAKAGATKAALIRWSCRWLIPAFALMPFCFAWYLSQVPESQRELLTLGMSTIGAGTFTQVTRAALIVLMTSATVCGLVYFLAYRSPVDFGWPHALSILLLALAATASTEYAREMLRKPYVIGHHMYSNAIRTRDADDAKDRSYLAASIWASTARSAEPASAPEIGRAVFRGQCGACHTTEGYRSMAKLLDGRDAESIANILDMLHDYSPESPYRRFMPPLVGDPAERAALAAYLHQLVQAPGDVAAESPGTDLGGE